MKTRLFFMTIAFGIISSCQTTQELDHPDQVKKVLTDYFDGIKDKDFDKMKAVTTEDFVLFEDGQIWNNDSLINLINSMPDFTAVYSFDDFNINIDAQNANMYYLNHMDLTLNDTTEVKYDWIESATFKKTEGIWKMNFLHSTRRK